MRRSVVAVLPLVAALVFVACSGNDTGVPRSPTAPSLKRTVLWAATGSKPMPLMVRVVVLAARAARLLVTTGATVATCTPALLTPSALTTDPGPATLMASP